MSSENNCETVQTVVIGGGQAGLSVGYHLARRGLPFVILEANARIGDSWRKRWDSLRLFTPARFDGLDGMPFPAPPHAFPTKDEMADYLEVVRRRFPAAGPHRRQASIGSSRRGNRYRHHAGDRRVRSGARRRGDGQLPGSAACRRSAEHLDPDIVQLHSRDYRRPGQLQRGRRADRRRRATRARRSRWKLARPHRTWMPGRDTGHVPFRDRRLAGADCADPSGAPRGVSPHPDGEHADGPQGPAGVISQGRAADSSQARRSQCRRRRARAPSGRSAGTGYRCSTDGRVLDVANVIWCTGFHPGFSWIDLPVFDARWRAEARERCRAQRAWPLFRRAALSVRDVVDDDSRRRARRRPDRRRHRGAHARRRA